MQRARAVLLALGDRLVDAGALEQRADVLLLEPDDLPVEVDGSAGAVRLLEPSSMC